MKKNRTLYNIEYTQSSHCLHYSLLNSSITLPVTPSAWTNDARMTSDTLFTVVEEKIGKVWGIETVLIMICQDGNVGLVDAI